MQTIQRTWNSEGYLYRCKFHGWKTASLVLQKSPIFTNDMLIFYIALYQADPWYSAPLHITVIGTAWCSVISSDKNRFTQARYNHVDAQIVKRFKRYKGYLVCKRHLNLQCCKSARLIFNCANGLVQCFSTPSPRTQMSPREALAESASTGKHASFCNALRQ